MISWMWVGHKGKGVYEGFSQISLWTLASLTTGCMILNKSLYGETHFLQLENNRLFAASFQDHYEIGFANQRVTH